MRNEPTDTLVFEDEDVTKHRDFRVTPEETGMEVPGPGVLDTLLLVADSDSFGVRVETRATELMAHDYDRLSKWTDELGHADAYEAEGSRVIAVGDFPFREGLKAEVKVRDTTSFEWVRAVYRLGPDAEY